MRTATAATRVYAEEMNVFDSDRLNEVCSTFQYAIDKSRALRANKQYKSIEAATDHLVSVGELSETQRDILLYRIGFLNGN